MRGCAVLNAIWLTHNEAKIFVKNLLYDFHTIIFWQREENRNYSILCCHFHGRARPLHPVLRSIHEIPLPEQHKPCTVKWEKYNAPLITTTPYIEELINGLPPSSWIVWPLKYNYAMNSVTLPRRRCQTQAWVNKLTQSLQSWTILVWKAIVISGADIKTRSHHCLCQGTRQSSQSKHNSCKP